MKRTNISIFIPHLGCPHRCSFCDQKSISGSAKAPSAAEVRSLLEEQAAHLAEKEIQAEIAFFGGSFTAVPEEYMKELLSVAEEAVKKYPVYDGIRCSTRPDCISEEILDILCRYGVTAIELGAQSMCGDVLAVNERGHTAEDVRRASEMIKARKIELGLQMMTGLYGDTPDFCRKTAEEFIALKPQTVRIYPTVILEGTRLGELYKSGEYRSFSFEETVDLCAELLRKFEENGISVIRMGLHASKEVERDMLGGVYHPAFREICESRLMYGDLLKILREFPKGSYTVYTDKRNTSRLIGQKRENILKLSEAGYDIKAANRQGAYLEISPDSNRGS